MDHVIGRRGDPDFRFPSDISGILPEIADSQEGRNVDTLGLAPLQERLDLTMPF